MKFNFYVLIFLLSTIITANFSCGKEDHPAIQPPDKWENLHAPYCGKPLEINFVNAKAGCVLEMNSGNNIILKTIDGGKTWDSIYLPHYLLMNTFGSMLGGAYIDSDKINIIYAVGKDGLMFSDNGGKKWRKTDTYNKIETSSMHFFNPSNGICLQGFGIYKTSDSGRTWHVVYKSDAFAFSFTMLQFTSPQTGYAAGGVSFDGTNFGMMVKTTNGGNTWQQIDYPFHDILSMYFINNDFGYISINMDSGNIATTYRNGSNLLKTENGGKTWIDVTPPTVLKNKDYISNLYFKNKMEGFCTISSIIYHTIDGGKTWQKEYNKYVSVLIFPDNHTGYAIDVTGAILKRQF